MPMSPMAPKLPLPKPAAFGLMDELLEYFKVPEQDKQAMLDDYKSAAEQREVALQTIEEALEASTVDRADALGTKRKAEDLAESILRQANAGAKQIVGAATAQAEDVTATLKEKVTATRLEMETAADKSQTREDAVKEREDAVEARWNACEQREASAFKKREDAVTLREDEATKRMREAEEMHALALSTKEGYDALLRQINALSTGPAAE